MKRFKNAYILPFALFALSLLSFVVVLSLALSSYAPRFNKDLSAFLQAEILSFKAKDLAKYLLIEAQNQGKECLNYTKIHYPRAQDIMEFAFFYPLAQCEDFKLQAYNKDANLSQDNIIAVSVNILLNANNRDKDAAVNDEIFIHESFYLYPKF